MKIILTFVLCVSLFVAGAHPHFANDVMLESDSTATPTWRDLIDAFLDGGKVDTIVKNTTNCVKNTESSFDNIESAILVFINKGWSWDNWLNFNGALGYLTPFIRTCYDVTNMTVIDFKYYSGKFQNFADFASQAKDNAMFHIFDWYDVIAKINDAIAKSDSKALAYQVGRALNLLLYFKPRGDANLVNTFEVMDIPDLRWLEDFMRGFLNGTRVLSSDRIKKCVNETEFMVKSLEDANKEFAKKTNDGFRSGVFEIGDMFSHMKPLNEQCYYGIGDVEAIIQKYITTFKSPVDILFNAARHFNQLYVDALSLMQHYRNSEYFNAGKDLGDAFYNVFCDK